jgi:hypothetical protein
MASPTDEAKRAGLHKPVLQESPAAPAASIQLDLDAARARDTEATLITNNITLASDTFRFVKSTAPNIATSRCPRIDIALESQFISGLLNRTVNTVSDEVKGRIQH